ncbi:winged helix-turn-helix domain-containing tetratricopeptide repeat protein [Kordiimonas sediminis]|uniref:winged helix-turn-helix domain-containing tetratricopeptide repeat protein n=1 Tax=Kordiimonas sediminis TaxID=1735581 RepID=UPI001E40CE3D|nr:winged helix-turn-helix domain-containing protein [Kordiimonas sediminis]
MRRKTYCFDRFEVDLTRFELRQDGERAHIEPQVLSLLILLLENRDKMVTKDEVIDEVWDGRIVSETAVASRLKAARKAIGDNGKDQLLIKTIHGRGFRFIGEVTEKLTSPPQTLTSPTAVSMPIPDQSFMPAPIQNWDEGGRPSIAVLPFVYTGEPHPHQVIADALPADIIMDLSRLHWLFVIARGSSFRFRGADTDPQTIGTALKVRYCLMGTIEVSSQTVHIGVSLVDTNTSETVWSDKYTGALSELQQMRPDIEASIVSSLEQRIPQHEVKLARSKPATELDAWASFHLGFDHMYRFTREDNAVAAELFQHSLKLDPYFTRSLAGLSFTHFQKAFLRLAPDTQAELDAARTLAHQALDSDRLDPFAHFSVGRSCWLDGELQDAVQWFDSATALSPSFAQGRYNRGLVNVMAGKPVEADTDLAVALSLSPLDPLAYAMVSSRSLVQLQLNEYEQAAHFAEKAARMPGAHRHIELIAALTAHLVGRSDDAQRWISKARQSDPDLNAVTFFQAFPFAQTKSRELIERTLKDMGL